MTGERIPESIRAAVDAIFDGVRADESLADAVARALLAERERAATIAENMGKQYHYDPDFLGAAAIAAAIRA